jgi:hypothetical protein
LRENWKFIAPLPIALALWGLAASLQFKTDLDKPKDWNQSTLLYLPSGQWVKPLALGYREGLASVLWVRGVLYFGEAYMSGRSAEWLGQFLNMVTLLNPRFHDAYGFTGSALAKDSAGRKAADGILRRGIAEFPQDWQLRVYAALNQMKLDSNAVQAAELLEPIALQEGIPNHIRTLAAGLLTQGGNERMALAYLTGQYLRTDNPMQREIFRDRLVGIFPQPEAIHTDSARVRTDIETLMRLAIKDPRQEPSVIGLLFSYLSSGFDRTSHPLLSQLLNTPSH